MRGVVKIGRWFYVRIAIPDDVRWYLPKREIKVSLKTSKKTLARRMAPSIISRVFNQIHQARMIMAHPSGNMPSERAFEIYQLQHPGKPLMEPVPYSATGPNSLEFRPAKGVLLNQSLLDHGYEIGPDGTFDISKLPLIESPQTIQPSPIVHSVVAPTQPAIQPHTTSLLVSEAYERYFQHCKTPEDRTHFRPRKLNSSEVTARNHLFEWIGSKQISLDELVKMDFAQFSRQLVENRGCNKSSVGTWIGCIQRFFKYAADFGHIEKSEVPQIKRPIRYGAELVKTANKAFSSEMLGEIFHFIVNTKPSSRRDRKTRVELTYFLMMLLYTGFRKTEGLCSSIEHYRGIPVSVQKETTKGNVVSIRWVPLHKDLISCHFMKYVAKVGEDEIFSKSDSTYRKRFNDILEPLGYKKNPREYTLHGMRSTFDSNLQGIVQDSTRHLFVGHSLQGMDKTYVEQLPDRVEMYRNEIHKLKYLVDLTQLSQYLKAELEELY